MALITNKCFAFRPALLAEIQPGDEVVGCNLAQAQSGTAIPAATYRGCNLLNCTPDAGAVVDDCLTVHKSLCYWLHVEYDEDGNVTSNPLQLPIEAENCAHVTETVEVDGMTLYVREDTVVS